MEIEKGVPIPKSAYDGVHSGAKPIYPFLDMEIGDSVFIEGATHYGKEWEAAKKTSQRHKRKFYRLQEGSGLRIWRIE